MKRFAIKVNNKLFFAAFMLLLALSVVLAVASFYPITTNDKATDVIIDDSFTLTPLETRRTGLGAFQGDENITLLITEAADRPFNFSLLTYGGERYSNVSTTPIRYSFPAGADYYEVAFYANATTVNDLSFTVTVQKPHILYPLSWLGTPAKVLFFLSWGVLIVLLLKSTFIESESPPERKNILTSLDNKHHIALVILLIVSLALWLSFLIANTYPFATFENWYTDHVRHPYSAHLFTKVGFSVFNTPLGELSSADTSFYKFITWPEMPNLYPVGSILLFLPFGLLLESGVTQILVFKIEIALFLVVSHICLYYFLKNFWRRHRMFSALEALGIYMLYIVLVVYSANGMFDAIALLFSLLGMILYFKGRYDYFILLTAFAVTFKYQAVILLFPLIIMGLLKLFKHSKLSDVFKNKAILLAAALIGFDVFTAYLSAPFLMGARPELVMNGINAFNPHAQIPWSLQAFAVLLTLTVTLICAVYVFYKDKVASLFMIFALLPSFLMPYFQSWYLSFFFVYFLFPMKKKTAEIAMLWLIFMMIVLSFGGLSYNPLHILDNLKRLLKL